MIFGFLIEDDSGALCPSSRYAEVICVNATALSNGDVGISPQSKIFAHDRYGFIPARALKPRNEVWREDAALIARGPNRAPGL